MYEIDSKLLELEAKGTPIRVSLIGCGQMGMILMHRSAK